MAPAQTLQATQAFTGSTAVGQSSAPITVTVTISASGAAEAPQVVTLGIANADFAVNPSSDPNACTTAAYKVGDTCTVSVVFQPKYPGTRSGAVVIEDPGAKSVLGSVLLTGTATGSLSVLIPGTINTVAGTGSNWIYQSDNVLATDAPVYLPRGVAVDAAGNLFLADASNNRIRRVDASTKMITTVAGNGTAGYSGDGGAATVAMINNPGGIALDGAGNLYFVDSNNSVIRRVDAVSGIITTVAGNGTSGYTGDGGAAIAAELSFSDGNGGLAFDTAGNLYIADTGNNVIREVNTATPSTISTVVGTGVAGYNSTNVATAAQLSGPSNISIGLDGSLYIADLGNQRVRKVTAGIITTIAGTGTQGFTGDGGLAIKAEVNSPAAVIPDPAGNLYIADAGNNRIRKISVTTGYIQTLSGGAEGESGDGGLANGANMYGPSSLFFDQSGNLVFADLFNNRVREIFGSIVTLPTYPTQRVGKISLKPEIEGMENDGNAILTIATPVLADAQLDPATTTCNAASTLTFNTAGNDCNFGVSFAPTATGDPATGSVTSPSDAGNSPAVIKLQGQVLTVQPSTVTLTSSLNPSLVGQAVTFTATIAAGGDVTTGTVAFLNGSTPIVGCTAVAEATSETASCTTSALPLGSNNITASYGGDPNDSSAVSAVLVQLVQQLPTVALTATPNPVTVTANVTLNATVTAPTGTPTGSVTFYNGSTTLGSATLGVGNIATFNTTSLPVGNQVLTATYTGDSTNAAATSDPYVETVSQAKTTTVLSSSNTSVPVGSPVTFTATVTTAISTPATGTVEFRYGPAGATLLRSVTLGNNGVAVFQTSSLAPGTYQVVAYYTGDTDDATSNSTPPVAQTITQIPTSTSLAATQNPISAGAILTLNSAVIATASATGAGAITGQVQFSEGAVIYGSVTINGAGDASFQISTLTAGIHNITATYLGNTNYATSTSTVLVETVNSTVTTTTLSSPAATTLAGEPATFNASVTSTTATPTGTVNFYDSGVPIGSGTLTAGVATLPTSALTVGVHTITATYVGNASYSTSDSNSLQHTVNLAATSLTLAGPATPVNAGSTFTMTSTLSSNGITPSGTVTLYNGSTTLASLPVTRDGTYTFSGISLGVGTYQLTAVYSGDGKNAGATSTAVTVVVQLTPTTTSLSSSLNPATVGQSVTFTATASGGTPIPSGKIEFLDGSTVLGFSTVNANGTATFTTTTLAYGTQSITASYQGDTDHAVSTSPAVSERIVQAATASLSSSVNPSIFGTNVVFSVRITGVNSLTPTGTVIFSDGASTLGTATLSGTGTASFQTSALAVGSHTISVSYSGDTNYSAVSTSLIQTVQNAATQISVASSANPAIYGTALTLTATVTGNGGVVGTGSVTFTDGGKSIGTAFLNANGIASLSDSTLTPGSHTIVANYAGDSNINASSSTPLTVIVKELTQVTLASSANPTSTLSSIVLTATVTNSGVGVPTGTITFTDGSTQLGTATLNASGVASITVPSLSAGNHPLQASYAGDATDFTSTSPVLTQGIQLRPTTTAITSVSADPNNPLQITLIAAVGWTGPVSPTGTVTFTSGTNVLGSSQVDSIGIATLNVIIPTATESIVATYSGDLSYATSASQAATISGGVATQFTMTLSPSSLTLQSTQHGTTSVTLASLEGFSDTLQLGCLGLPFAATCTFAKPQVVLASNGTQVVQLYIDTGDPLGAGATAKLEKSRMSGVLMCLLPCLLAIGVGARRKKFKASTLLLLVCMVAITLSAAGCGGLTINGTPAGTYTFKVTAAGQGTGATISQTMTLTVTK